MAYTDFIRELSGVLVTAIEMDRSGKFDNDIVLPGTKEQIK